MKVIAGEYINVGEAVCIDPQTGKAMRAIGGSDDKPIATAAEPLQIGDTYVVENDPQLGTVLRKVRPT